MKIISFLFAANALIAQEASSASSAAATTSQNKSILIIDPKARCTDYVQAFDLLRKDKPTLKIMLRTTSGILGNATEITAGAGGTVLFVKLLSNQGTKTHIVPIEELMEINYSP